MNAMKTTILLAALTGVLVIFGGMLGGQQGATLALLIAGVMNFGSLFYSDKIVLKMYKAQEVGPEELPQLYNIVKNLAIKNDMPMPKVYAINSESPNAFATGRSPKHASVAATVGIMRLLNEEELEGVMAHEMAHVKNRDTLISTIAATIAGAITWLAMMARWGAIFGGGMRGGSSNRNNLFGTLALAILAPIAAMFIQMAISRSREFAADSTGAKLCGKPLSLASALLKLQQGAEVKPMKGSPSTAHMFIVNPFRGGMSSLFSTHPPMEDRVQKLRDLSRQMA